MVRWSDHWAKEMSNNGPAQAMVESEVDPSRPTAAEARRKSRRSIGGSMRGVLAVNGSDRADS